MSHSKTWSLTRRTALRGAGASMSLPLLEAMLPTARSLAAGADGQPVRFAAFFMPNGVDHSRWDPKGTSIKSLPSSLEPLQELSDYLTVIKKMNNADGGHAAGTAAFLTGRRPKRTGKASEVNVGNASLDQIIGRAAKDETVLPTLELGMHTPRRGVGMSGHSHVYTSFMSWKTATTPVPHEINPQRAFDRLFKGARVTAADRKPTPGSEPPTPDKSVLDLVLEDAKSLQKRLGRADQQKLDEYLTAVRDVEERIAFQSKAAAGLRITPEVLEEIRGVRRNLVRSIDSRDRGISALPSIPYREYGRLMMDVMALALWSNSSRATTLMFGDGLHGRNMSFLDGVDGNHHSISHHGNKPQNLKTFAAINRFFASQYGYFLERLRGMREGSSNVLENSVVLLGSNISAGQQHGGNNIPVLVGGHAGGRLRGGRCIDAEGESIGSLHRSVLDLVGVDADIGGGKGKLRGV